MQVLIKETGVIAKLQWIGKNGIDCIEDVIGNHDGFGSEDWQFLPNRETGVHTANQDTFDWWEKVAAENEAVEERIAALTEEHGSDVVWNAYSHVDTELEYQARAITKALDEAFGAPVK
ncbi:MAG: hypothetical protein J7559_18715 [Cohnella sp.]|nr:hypothetical protein [Cohnella sp.]